MLPLLALSLVAPGLPLRAQSAAATADPAPAPQIAYQGRLLEAGQPVTGTRNFTFVLLDGSGNELWNPGQQSLPVTNGYYLVVLGGSGMAPLPVTLVGNALLRLRISISGVTLTPDVELVPALQGRSTWEVLGPFSGDANGTEYAMRLAALQGIPLDLSTAPSTGQALLFDGSAWKAGTPVTRGAMGPAGATGDVGAAGAQGPAGLPGSAGAKGDAGPVGLSGGRAQLHGAGNPVVTGATGAVGDYYLDTSTQTLYGPKVGANWTGLTGVLLRGATGAAGASGPIAPGISINPLQIAMARWYGANTGFPAYAVGTKPRGLCFDGTNVWVVNETSGNVMKLNAFDASLVGTYSVGAAPRAALFDGLNIWVSNSADNTVTKLLASSGALVGTYPVGAGPAGLTFDGTHLWMANAGATTVTKLKASDGSLVGTHAVGTGPVAAACDGAYVWVANYTSNTVSKLKASDGSLVGTFAAGTHPVGIASDGTNTWVICEGSKELIKLLGSDGHQLGTFSTTITPRGLAFDGVNVWVSCGDGTTNVAAKYLASDGTLLGTYPVGSWPEGVTFDGINVWVANNSSDTVSKL
jgi:hypothetical protein